MQMFNAEQLQEKWAPVLDYDGMDPIKDPHRRAVTAILLENQERETQEERNFLSEQPTQSTGSSGLQQVSLPLLVKQSLVSTQY